MPREHRYYVYLLTNKNDKVMYVGVTNNLERRVYEHKAKMVPGFTEKYNLNKLVYFEETSDVQAAITREKEIKKWRREKKNNLVIAINPEWKDLSDGWFEISPFGRDDKSGGTSCDRYDKGRGTSCDRYDKGRGTSCDQEQSVISTPSPPVIPSEARNLAVPLGASSGRNLNIQKAKVNI